MVEEIRVSIFNSYTPLEQYTLFKKGYRYRTDWNITNVSGNTTYPNSPQGLSGTRLAGGTVTTYSGYGKVTTSLDEAWEIYLTQYAVPPETQDPPINELSDMVDDMFKVEIDLPVLGEVKQWYILAGVAGVVVAYFFLRKGK